MAAESTRDGTTLTPPSSPLCPECGIRPRVRNGERVRGYCRECDLELQRIQRTYHKKNRSTSCRKCGAKKGKGEECAKCAQRRTAGYGEQRIRERFPGLAEALTAALSDAERLRLFGNFYRNKSCRLPRPSQLFSGIDAALDQRLIREHRDKDVTLCQALAKIAAADQRDFLELYLVDPADAQHWATLPTWKRPIRKGDDDDQQIWKFFTMQRLNMEQAARDAPPWSLASQGAQLPQMFGALVRLSPAGLQKLVAVMNTYGVLLQHGRELGNVTKKPWENA